MRFIIKLFILFLIVEVFLSFGNSVRPAYVKVIAASDAYRQQQEKTNQINKLEDLAKVIESRQDFQRLAQDESEFFMDQYLPSSFKEYEAVAIISSVLKKNGFPSTGIAFEDKGKIAVSGTGQSPISEKSISFSVRGSYNQMMGLMKDIENHSRVFAIKSVTLSGEDIVTGSFIISTYYLNPIYILPQHATSDIQKN